MNKYLLILSIFLFTLSCQNSHNEIVEQVIPQTILQPHIAKSLEQTVIHYDLALDHYKKQQFEKAAKEWALGAEYFPYDTLRKADFYNNVGHVYFKKINPPRYPEAIKAFGKAIKIREQLNDFPGDNCKAIAEMYADLGEYAKCSHYYEKAISHLEQKNYNNNLALSYIGLGEQGYRNEGKFEEAIKALKTAEHLWKKNSSHLEQASIYIGLGNVYFDKSMYEKAIEHYLAGLKELKKSPNQKDIKVIFKTAQTLNNIGTNYTELKNMDLASAFLFQSLKLKLKLGETYKTTISSTYNNFGEFYLEKNELDSAYQHYQHAIQLVTDTTSKSELGVKYDIKKHYLPTSLQIQNSISQPSLVTYLSDQAKFFKTYYHQTKDIDDLKNAHNTYLVTDTLIHILLNKLTEGSQMIWVKKARNIYEEAISVSYQLYQITKDKAYLESAFNFAESNKAVILQRKIQLYNTKEYKRLSNILNKIQTELYSDDVLVEYFVGKDSIYIFGITKNNIQCERVAYSEQLKSEIDNFNKYATTKPSSINAGNKTIFNNYIKDAHSIYTTLIKPVLKKSNRIVIVPDDILFHLPFAALLTSSTISTKIDFNLPYLIKKHPITYTPSVVSLLNMPKQEMATSFSNPGIYAPKVFDYKNSTDKNLKLKPLPQLQKTAIAIHNTYNSELSNDTVLLNDFYTTFQKHETLIMATHAKASETVDNAGYIAFSDSVLSVRDIYRNDLNMKGKCIILSSCEGADGYIQTGEGIMSITRAFIYKGSSNVLSALWSVDDTKTSMWLSSLSKYLSKGYDKPKALQLAQKDLIKENQHPFYWAAFTHTGTWEAGNVSFFANNQFLILLVGIGLAVGLLIFWRKKR